MNGNKTFENFIYKGKVVEFSKISGEVIDSSKSTRTHISSSISTIGNQHVPQIHSVAVTNHDIWIKTADGLEQEIQLRGVDIPLRTGQKITVISAGREGTGGSYYTVLVNHSAEKHWYIESMKSLNVLLKLERPTCMSVIWSIVIFIGIVLITACAHTRIDGSWWSNASWGLAFFSACAFFVYRVIHKFKKIHSIEAMLKTHLGKLAQSTY